LQGIHAKDGLWPTNPRELGQEVPIGKGKVDFPRIIARLKELTIAAPSHRAGISGPQQMEDVRGAKALSRKTDWIGLAANGICQRGNDGGSYVKQNEAGSEQFIFRYS